MPETAAALARLIHQARAGDSVALSCLCAHYRPLLRQIAQHSVSPAVARRADASDIVQQTELELFEAIRDFRGETEAELTAWLKKMLGRNIADAVRDNRAEKRDVRREKFIDDACPAASIVWFQPAGREASPSRYVMIGETARHLASILETLPEQQREVVRLRHIEGLGVTEVAERLGKTPGAVVGLLRRGLAALREKMVSESKYL
jgi:RNA polymerase sigma-70 factor, ECF subfamily